MKDKRGVHFFLAGIVTLASVLCAQQMPRLVKVKDDLYVIQNINPKQRWLLQLSYMGRAQLRLGGKEA